MEQIRLFFAEEAGLMVAGTAVLNLILFAVTLHKIKRMEKHNRELLRMTECILSQLDGFGKAYCQVEKEKEEPKEQGLKPEKTETAEELLNAVLTEVFP